MATRGTYKVDGVLLYNHWDNYPSGARAQLSKVLEKYGNLDLFSVIRGMENIMPTKSVYDGPAEFHYVIENHYIKMYDIQGDSELTLIDHGTIEDWINRGVKKNKFVQLGHSYYKQSTLYANGVKNYKLAIETLDKGMVGNASSIFIEAFKLINASGKRGTRIKKEYLQKYSPILADAYKHSDTELFDSYINK
jgi:hypothetical protein